MQPEVRARQANQRLVNLNLKEAPMLYPVQNQFRQKLDLSGMWDFETDAQCVGETSGWANGLKNPRPMAVPGSWNEQYEDLFGYFDLGWYLKKTHIPHQWQGQRVFLRVGSANYFSTVYVNGTMAGSHECGHLPFAFEITDMVNWNQENVIAISVENVLKPTRVPSGNMPKGSSMGMFVSSPATTFDFYPYAGLHRPVVLYTVPQTFIEDISVVTSLEGSNGIVRVSARLNTSLTQPGSLTLTGAGAQLSANLRFENGCAQAALVVPGARLWSDRDPFLYDLSVNIDGDTYRQKIGIRTVEVRGGQILLNGQPVQLNGFGRHEDFYASGKGLNLPLLVKDYDNMRWVGANSYRTSHYPYSEEEMQLADRMGMLVIAEIPAVSLQMADEENIPARLKICLQQIDELIARDKNHPSVVAWSVANEPMPSNLALAGAGGGGDNDPAAKPGKAMLDAMLAHARELDPTRPVTLVTVMGGPQSWMEQCDFICMNRYWGWYVLGGQLQKARAMLEMELDQVWQKFHKPIVMTEFGADTIPGFHGHPDVMWTEEYQAELIRMHLQVAAARQFVAGMHVWVYADFAAVQSVARVSGINYKGVFTRARQPKTAAHVLRSFWKK